MTARTIWLCRFIGLFALVTGFGMLLRGSDFATTMELIVADRPLLFVIGIAALSAGLAIVLVHNVWSGGAATIIITVIGWLSTLRGVFILWTPADVATRLVGGLNLGALASFYIAIFILVGLYLTYAGFRARTAAV